MEYGIDISNFVRYRAVIGDTSDNIKGVRGFGEKTTKKHFSKLLKQDTEVTYQRMLKQLQNTGATKRLIDNFKDSEQIIDMNIRLMDLTTQQLIDNNAKMAIQNILRDSPPHKLSEFQLRSKFTKAGVMSAMRNFD